MKYIYAVTEENIDWRGISMTEYVSSAIPLNQEKKELLAECLRNVKQKAIENNDCSNLSIMNANVRNFSTRTLVFDAIEKFQEKTGIELEHILYPYEAEITF